MQMRIDDDLEAAVRAVERSDAMRGALRRQVADYAGKIALVCRELSLGANVDLGTDDAALVRALKTGYVDVQYRELSTGRWAQKRPRVEIAPRLADAVPIRWLVLLADDALERLANQLRLDAEVKASDTERAVLRVKLANIKWPITGLEAHKSKEA